MKGVSAYAMAYLEYERSVSTIVSRLKQAFLLKRKEWEEYAWIEVDFGYSRQCACPGQKLEVGLIMINMMQEEFFQCFIKINSIWKYKMYSNAYVYLKGTCKILQNISIMYIVFFKEIVC